MFRFNGARWGNPYFSFGAKQWKFACEYKQKRKKSCLCFQYVENFSQKTVMCVSYVAFRIIRILSINIYLSKNYIVWFREIEYSIITFRKIHIWWIYVIVQNFINYGSLITVKYLIVCSLIK